ncbi:kinase-like protein [Nemania sp. FL0916]|nr:kinase-like protein [Nemania sp. FL0916]
MSVLRRAPKAKSVTLPRVWAPMSLWRGGCRRSSHIAPYPYTCDIDAEPPCRYKLGGYHPIHLGDKLKSGRYKILHKVGHGGNSTTWAARDQEHQRYVAVKICVAEADNNREVGILQLISSSPKSSHRGSEHIVQLLDDFSIDGPNGKHQCIVMELLGHSIQELTTWYLNDYRLPARAARSIAHQVLLGVDFLTKLNIAQGDIHTRNVALALPCLDSLNEQEFVHTLGKPELGTVRRIDGAAPGIHLPSYIVRPTSFEALSVRQSLEAPIVKIIDFGQSFHLDRAPATVQTPLVVRPPEVLFGDPIDHRVDLWSVGCLIFELFTGRPPFDNISLMTVPDQAEQMIEYLAEELPDRWQAKWQAMQVKLQEMKEKQAQHYTDHDGDDDADSPHTLQECLERAYYFDERRRELTEQDLAKIGDLVRRLLRWEPADRSSAKDIANDLWFQQ